MPWTTAGAGEAATAAEGRTAGALGPKASATEGGTPGGLGPAAMAAPGVEVLAGGVELRCTRGW